MVQGRLLWVLVTSLNDSISLFAYVLKRTQQLSVEEAIFNTIGYWRTVCFLSTFTGFRQSWD